ncbi:MAG: hypothetical protein NT113_06370 [Hyphomicrobiales bacterium]|jgi:hypothetical protein|nr:hypothetical protein [Hyphomicrobiales bacterium]
MTDSNLIEVNFRIGKRKPEPRPLNVSEREIEIGGDLYTVRRVIEAHGGGFMIIRDAVGDTVLVRSSAIPDEYVPDLIVAHRAGVKKGRMLGRRDVCSEIAAEVLR